MRLKLACLSFRKHPFRSVFAAVSVFAASLALNYSIFLEEHSNGLDVQSHALFDLALSAALVLLSIFIVHGLVVHDIQADKKRNAFLKMSGRRHSHILQHYLCEAGLLSGLGSVGAFVVSFYLETEGWTLFALTGLATILLSLCIVIAPASKASRENVRGAMRTQ